MVCIGLVIGSVLAFLCRQFAASFIQDLNVSSGVPLAFGAMTMVAIALFAAYLPARRAAKVEPMEALRYE